MVWFSKSRLWSSPCVPWCRQSDGGIFTNADCCDNGADVFEHFLYQAFLCILLLIQLQNRTEYDTLYRRMCHICFVVYWVPFLKISKNLIVINRQIRRVWCFNNWCFTSFLVLHLVVWHWEKCLTLHNAVSVQRWMLLTQTQAVVYCL